jgi:hypothetical protein
MPKSKGYEPFRRLLTEALGREPHHDGHSFHFKASHLSDYLRQFGHAQEKYIPKLIKEMSARQLEIFWRFYMLGDGHYANNADGTTRESICTVSRVMADDLQEIAQKMGYSAGVYWRDATKDTVGPHGGVIRKENQRRRYDVRLRTSETAHFNIARVRYEGKVYCVSVPNETLYVRRNGRPAWCCNTVKPLLSNLGRRPAPPDPAFQQIMYGFPRGEFTAPVGADGTVEGGLSADELIYSVRNLRPHSPYGFGPVENALVRINLWLKRTEFMTRQFDSSALPLAFLELPEASTVRPEELRRWREAINSQLSGDLAERQRIQLGLPGGKLAKFADSSELYKPEYDTYIVKLVCASFGITPAEIGFIETGGLGGSSYHEGQENIQYRKLLLPWCRWLEGIFNRINRRYLGLDPAVQFRFLGLEEEDEAAADLVLDGRVKSGRLTLNEARDKMGLPPFGIVEADEPFVVYGRGVLFLDGQKALQEAQVEAQKAGADMAQQNFSGGHTRPNAEGDKAEGEDGPGPDGTEDDEQQDDEPPPKAGSKPVSGGDGASKVDGGGDAKPALKSAAAELDMFAKWAGKLVKGNAKLRTFAFTTVDADTARQLNHLVLDDAPADAALLARATAAELRRAGGGGGGRVESPRPERGAGGLARFPGPRRTRAEDGRGSLPGCWPPC